MKKTITLLLTLCLLLCLLPTEAVAYLGDIQTVDSGTVTAKKLNSGSWELRNDYLRVIVRKDGTLSTAPAADSADPTGRRRFAILLHLRAPEITSGISCIPPGSA